MTNFLLKPRMLRCFLYLLMCSAMVAKASDVTFDADGSYRLRYEYLDSPIFPTSSDSMSKSNDRLSSRLLLKGQVNWNNWNGTVEIQDSRAWLDDNDPTLGSSQVNTLEPLQFFVRYSPQGRNLKAFTSKSSTSVALEVCLEVPVWPITSILVSHTSASVSV